MLSVLGGIKTFECAQKHSIK